jgi:hypothetical protein
VIVANQPVHRGRGSSSECGPVRWWRHSIPSLGLKAALSSFLTDGARASIGTIVTEAQHMPGSGAVEAISAGTSPAILPLADS